MTNEQLAEYIQGGGNDELIPILWERIKKLMYMKSDSVYRLYKDQCDKSGVDVWDIKQACYGAFLQAVHSFKPEQEYKFTTFLAYPFKNAVRGILGLQTERAKNEPLNNCVSLDKPINEDEGNDTTLKDMVEDIHSNDFIEDMDTEEECALVRQAVSELKAPMNEIIEMYYFKGMTQKAIAVERGCSMERIRQIKAKALRQLRKSKTLKQIYRFQIQEENRRYWSRFIYSPQYFDVISALEQQIAASDRTIVEP